MSHIRFANMIDCELLQNFLHLRTCELLQQIRRNSNDFLDSRIVQFSNENNGMIEHDHKAKRQTLECPKKY